MIPNWRTMIRPLSSCTFVLGLAGMLAACDERPGGLPAVVPTPASVQRIPEFFEPDTSQFTEPAVVAQIEDQLDALRESRESDEPEAIAAAHGEAGMLFLTYQLTREAQRALEIAASLDPQEPRWLYYLAHTYKQEGAMAEAAALYQRIVEIDPEHRLGRIQLAGALQALDRDEEAFQMAEAMLRDYGEIPVIVLMLGEAAMKRGDYEEAAKRFRRVLQLQPSATKVHYQLAQAYQRLGDSSAAEEELALQGEGPVETEDPLLLEVRNLNKSSYFLVQRGDMRMDVGRPDLAAVFYGQAIESAPERAVPHAKLAAAHATQGELDEAIASFEAAIALAVDDDEVGTKEVGQMQQQIGKMELSRGRLEEAERAFERALEIDAGNAGALGDLADVYRRSGRCEEAADRFRDAIALDPTDMMLRVRLALCLTKLGRHAEALTVIEAAHQEAPNDPEVRDALARLLSASPREDLRDGERALPLAFAAAAEKMSIDRLETLAMAQAETGAFEDAIKNLQLAIDQAEKDRPFWHAALLRSMDRYRQGLPSSEPWPDFLFER